MQSFQFLNKPADQRFRSDVQIMSGKHTEISMLLQEQFANIVLSKDIGLNLILPVL